MNPRVRESLRIEENPAEELFILSAPFQPEFYPGLDGFFVLLRKAGRQRNLLSLQKAGSDYGRGSLDHVGLGHARHPVGHTVGFSFEPVPRLVDDELGLE